MKTYELTYIISPEISSQEAEAFGKEIEFFIQSKEGVILKQLTPTPKTLAYPIKNYASGFMGVLEFQLEPEKLIDIKENLDKNEKINRYTIIIKKMIKQKKERRQKKQPAPTIEKESEVKPEIKIEKEKVELKDIEQQLDEILGQ